VSAGREFVDYLADIPDAAEKAEQSSWRGVRHSETMKISPLRFPRSVY